jgi:AcrR family transcriptional regulator
MHQRGRGNRNDDGSKRSPGRPRSEQARLSVLRTTLQLLAKKGFPELTIEAVAAHAGVAKATVYRWWPDKAALIADAFASNTTSKLHFPDTGTVRTDMSQQMCQLVKIFRSPRGKIVSALLGAGQSDRSLIRAFRERFLMPRRREAYATLQRAIDRGQLRKDIDMDLLLDSLYGPIYMRFLIQHDRLSDKFVDGLCAMTFGCAAGTKISRKHVRS